MAATIPGSDQGAGWRGRGRLVREARPGTAPFLEPGAWLLAGFYALSAAIRALGPERGQPTSIAVLALSSLLLAAVAIAAHTARSPGARRSMVAGIGFLVVANGVVQLWVGTGPEDATHLGLGFVVLGAFVSGRTYLVLAALGCASWLTLSQRYGDVTLRGHFNGFLALAVVLGFVLLVSRRYREQEVAHVRTVEDGLSDDVQLTLGWYRKLFHESPALMCVHDTDGRVEEVNPAGLEALGYPRQDVVGRNIMEFMVPLTEDGPEQYLRDIQRLGWTEGLLRARRADGSLRIWEYRSTIIQTGTEVQVLATAADITELAEARDRVASEPDPRLG